MKNIFIYAIMGFFISSCKKEEKPVIPPPCQVICTLVDEQTNLPIPNVKTVLNYGYSSGIVYSNAAGEICYPGTGRIYDYTFSHENYMSKHYEWIEWNSVIKLQRKAYLRIHAHEIYSPFSGYAILYFENPWEVWCTVSDGDTFIVAVDPSINHFYATYAPYDYDADIYYTAVPGDTVDVEVVF